MNPKSWQPTPEELQLIDLALAEDLNQPHQDITTALLFANNQKHGEAKIVSKHTKPIVFCGTAVIEILLNKLGSNYKIISEYVDGNIVQPHASLVTLHAPAYILLMLERTLLNFLQHLCSVATVTQNFVAAIAHTHAKILDTRKTLPGFRRLDKYAVHCGGGVNHRMGLYDAVMIKDTHVDMLGGMARAVDKLPQDILETYPVIVEVRNEKELEVVLQKGPKKVSRILLDNMSPALIQKCVVLCAGIFPTEASGNINFDNVKTIAECGVDFISIGKLTHSAPHVDLSMRCDI